ncbi:MAG: DUF6279 family lipoprotein [Shewanella sp.]|uniref:DUF6279 family lipoprotein n=1 Tax=Shewanella sp. TaxID=50422 RepID=UPI003F2ACAC4
MKQRLLLMVLLLTLSACSTKLSYRFLDWAIGWEVEDYVTLKGSQQRALDTLINQFVQWHQTEELAHYVAQLTEIKRLIDTNTLTPALWVEQVNIAKRHWFRLFEFALPQLLPIIVSLSDAQVQQIMTTLHNDEQALIKEFAGKSPEQLQQQANDELQAQFTQWLGSLTAQQKEMIYQYNKQRLSTLDMWLEYRHEWLRQFDIALGQRADSAQLTARLTLLMTQADELKSAQHKAFVRQNSELFGALILDMHASLSAKQSKHFYRKLNNLIDDLRELNQEAKTSG